MNYFSILECPEQMQLDLDQLKTNYQTQAAKHHPDNNGDEAQFKLVNQAYQALQFSHTRLKHLLEIANIEFSSRGAVSSEVMDFFMPTGELIQAIDKHLHALSTSSSALQKALLSTKSLTLQSQIESLLENLDQQEQSIESKLADIDLNNIAERSELASTSARDLTFLIKWKAELRDRYAKLFV